LIDTVDLGERVRTVRLPRGDTIQSIAARKWCSWSSPRLSAMSSSQRRFCPV